MVGVMQILRTRLRAHGEHASWTTLRRILEGQQRVTATFRRPDGRTAACAHGHPSRTRSAGHLRRARRRPTPRRRPQDARLTDRFPRFVRVCSATRAFLSP